MINKVTKKITRKCLISLQNSPKAGGSNAKYVFLYFVEKKSSRTVNRCIFIVCCLMCVYGLSCLKIFSALARLRFSAEFSASKAKFTSNDARPRRSVANVAAATLPK